MFSLWRPKQKKTIACYWMWLNIHARALKEIKIILPQVGIGTSKLHLSNLQSKISVSPKFLFYRSKTVGQACDTELPVFCFQTDTWTHRRMGWFQYTLGNIVLLGYKKEKNIMSTLSKTHPFVYNFIYWFYCCFSLFVCLVFFFLFNYLFILPTFKQVLL